MYRIALLFIGISLFGAYNLYTARNSVFIDQSLQKPAAGNTAVSNTQQYNTPEKSSWLSSAQKAKSLEMALQEERLRSRELDRQLELEQTRLQNTLNNYRMSQRDKVLLDMERQMKQVELEHAELEKANLEKSIKEQRKKKYKKRRVRRKTATMSGSNY